MYHNVMKPHNAMQSLVMTAKMRPRVKQDSAGIPEQFWLTLSTAHVADSRTQTRRVRWVKVQCLNYRAVSTQEQQTKLLQQFNLAIIHRISCYSLSL